MSYSKWYQFIKAAHTEAEIKQFISSNAADLNDSFRSDYEGIGISFNGRFNPLRIAIEAGKEIFVKCLLLAGPTFNMGDYTLGYQRQEILEKQFVEVMKKVDDLLTEEERATLIKKDYKMTQYLKTRPSKATDKTISHGVPPIAPSSQLPGKPAAFFSNSGNTHSIVSAEIPRYTKWNRFIKHEEHSEAEIKQFIAANSDDLTDSFLMDYDGRINFNGRFNPLRIAIEAGAAVHVKCLLLAGSIFKKAGYSLGYNDQEKLEREFREVILMVCEISNETELTKILNNDPKIPEYLKGKTPTAFDETPSYNVRYRF